MSTESIRLIVESLNQEPFNLNTTLIAFDTFSPQRLLQILTDVLCWITQTDKIDIRNESADQTALRVFNTLRILKFRPPSDIEQLDEWRVGIVEGAKSAVYPVLYYIFSNVDMLKERAYLAKYLVRIEIPGEVQDVDTQQLQNDIFAVMEMFKETHQKVVDVRADSLLIEDIKTDLRTMDQEKEQLTRRIERVQRKVQNLPNLERIVETAQGHRLEVERLETLTVQRVEQRNAVIQMEQKIQRLQSHLREVQKQGENIDPSELIAALEDEIETNRYLSRIKLAREIQSKRGIVGELSKIAEMPAIDQSDVNRLKEEVESRASRIMTLEEERDKKEESHDENFSIYRHQAATVERKKSNAAQKLQEARNDLEQIESQIATKKEELRSQSGEEVITSMQFKNFVNKLRLRTNIFKKRRGEMEELKNEKNLLIRTVDILSSQWNDLKDKIEEMGGDVTETIEVPKFDRPKTAKPKTDNIQELKQMLLILNDKLDVKRTILGPLQAEHETMTTQFNEELETMREKKKEYEQNKAALESDFVLLQQEVETLEHRRKSATVESEILEIKVKVGSAQLQKISNGELPEVIRQIEDMTTAAQAEAEVLQKKNVNEVDVDVARQQTIMWKSLLKIFEMKMAAVQTER